MKRAKVWKMGKVCQNTKPTHLMSSVFFFLTNYKVLFTSTNNYLLYHVLLIATN